MSLFVDGSPATVEDLTAFDSSVLNVANTEEIDVTSKLELTRTLLAVDLEALIPGGIDGVVVTTSLRAFHIVHTLEQVYRDAFNSQLNDRYEGKWRQYEALRRDAWQRLLETGIGVVDQPVPKPARPELTSVAGTGAEGLWYVRTTWVNARGEEGEASDATEWSATSSSVLRVRTASAPKHAVSWNVYIGAAPEETSRQNASGLDPGTSWTQAGPVQAGSIYPRKGQPATYTRVVPRLLWRG